MIFKDLLALGYQEHGTEPAPVSASVADRSSVVLLFNVVRGGPGISIVTKALTIDVSAHVQGWLCGTTQNYQTD